MLNISVILGEYVNKAYGTHTIKTVYRKRAVESSVTRTQTRPWVNIYSMTFR